MEEVKQGTLVRKFIVLTAVLGFTLTGWLVGHILRFSIPAHDFQHPPTEEIDPKIKIGLEADGIQRQFVFTGKLGRGVFTNEGTITLGEYSSVGCLGMTYYTSLPAKCRTADGKLVRVGGDNAYIILIPGDK